MLRLISIAIIGVFLMSASTPVQAYFYNIPRDHYQTMVYCSHHRCHAKEIILHPGFNHDRVTVLKIN